MQIAFFADTHGRHEKLKTFQQPYVKGIEDYVLIHGGDITENGTEAETNDFLKWFAKQPCEHKIFIGGNHDLFLESRTPIQLKKLIPSGVTYLNNTSTTVDGYTIWGSPVTPYFLGMAFNKKRGAAIKRVWNKIPVNTDILVTHGPPKGILDGGFGCEDLLNRVAIVKPSLHLFGHIHGQLGGRRFYETNFVNRALADNKDPIEMRAHKMLAEPMCLTISIGKINALKTGNPKIW